MPDGTTDVPMSRLVFGAMTFGSQVDQSAADAMAGECFDAGVTMFDTANSYNGGRSEEILGKAVKAFRDQILIASKVGSPNTGAAPGAPRLDRASIQREVEGSLRRLGTDRLDLYYMHRPDPVTPLEESLAAMDELVRAGKVRAVGHSNHAAWQAMEADLTSREHGWVRPTVSQPMYNLLARRVEAEYLPCAKRLGLFTITYNALAGGLLTGKHHARQLPEQGSRFAQPVYRERYWRQELHDAVDALSTVAARAGLSLVELSLRWLLSQPAVDAVLLGASSIEQLRANLAAAQGPALGAETMAECDDVWARLAGASPEYMR